MLNSKISNNKLNFLISKNQVLFFIINTFKNKNSFKVILEKKNVNINFFYILLLSFTFHLYGYLVKNNNQLQKNYNYYLYFTIKNVRDFSLIFNKIFLLNSKEFKLDLVYNYIFKNIKKKLFIIDFKNIRNIKNNLNLHSYFFL
jgi:hypothetical protein